MTTATRWHSLMQQLGFEPNTSTADELIAAYGEKHRFYHTLTHLEHCLKELDEYQGDENKAIVELALWFHDAIYRPLSGDNEEQSAQWAKRFLQQQGASEALQQTVYALIMATTHQSPPVTPEEKLLIDIDLSILGADKSSFTRFEKNVRREFKRVPGIVYKSKRKQVLNHFLERERIYHSDDFFQRYEAQARENLKRAVTKGE